jgi:hypothetical protein
MIRNHRQPPSLAWSVVSDFSWAAQKLSDEEMLQQAVHHRQKNQHQELNLEMLIVETGLTTEQTVVGLWLD